MVRKYQWLTLAVISAVAVLSFYYLGSREATKPPAPVSNTSAPQNEQGTQNNGQPVKSSAPNNGITLAPDGPTSQKANDQEIKNLRQMTDENTKKIYAKMKQDEIKSLKESIINDEKLLKQIEVRGSGIEDYKLIETNLAKRRQRLKELSKK